MIVGALFLIVLFLLYISDELDSDTLTVLILIALFFYTPLVALILMGIYLIILIIRGLAYFFEKLQERKDKDNSK